MAITRKMNGSLQVSGLSAGSNVIPHGLPVAPLSVGLRPNTEDRLGVNPTLLWSLTSVDATNITINVATGGATSGNIDFWTPAY